MEINTLRLAPMSLPASVKSRLRDGWIHRWMKRREETADISGWETSGFPLPPPQAYKQKLIREMAQRFRIRVLVETGTHHGNTIAGALGTFDRIYSIELSEELYLAACRRFQRHPKVRLRNGNSAQELPKILKELDQPALFWLDAHFSGGDTARADIDTPIVKELQTIGHHVVNKHLLLIDDARCFDGTNDYPTIDACRQLTAKLWPNHAFKLEHDIMRITPQ